MHILRKPKPNTSGNPKEKKMINHAKKILSGRLSGWKSKLGSSIRIEGKHQRESETL